MRAGPRRRSPGERGKGGEGKRPVWADLLSRANESYRNVCAGRSAGSRAASTRGPPPPGPGAPPLPGEEASQCRILGRAAAAWARLPLRRGRAGRGCRRRVRPRRRPPACCTLGTRPRPAGGTRLRAARGGRSTPPARPGPAPAPRSGTPRRCPAAWAGPLSRGPVLRNAGPGRQGRGVRRRSGGCEALGWACTDPGSTQRQSGVFFVTARCCDSHCPRDAGSGERVCTGRAAGGEQSQNHRKDE